MPCKLFQGLLPACCAGMLCIGVTPPTAVVVLHEENAAGWSAGLVCMRPCPGMISQVDVIDVVRACGALVSLP